MFSCLFGLFFFIKGRKTGAKLLQALGLTYFFAGLIYFGDSLDFVHILITGTNIDNSTGIIGLINWMWFPAVIFCAMYIGGELLIPNKRWYLFTVYLILGILFDVFLFLDPAGSVTYDNPTTPGTDLINDNLVEDSIVYFLALFFLLSIIVVLGFGFLIKAIQTRGTIRKKFFYLSIGSLIYTIGGILDGLFAPGVILIFVRTAMIGSAWIFYLGLRT